MFQTLSDDINPLEQENLLLREQIAQLERQNETLRQESHIIAFKLQATTKANTDLSNELESVTAEYKDKIKRLNMQHDVVLKGQLADATEEVANLEKEHDIMRAQIVTLTERLKLAELRVTEKPSMVTDFELESDLSQQNASLKLEVEAMEMSLYKAQLDLGHVKEELEMQQEKYKSVLSNLNCKQEQNEELLNLLDATQQQVAVLAAENEALRSNPEHANMKGNSLFAEVADQRKQLINIIMNIKQRYYALRKEHRDCPSQLRSLRNLLHEIEQQNKLYMVKLQSAEHSQIKALNDQNKDMDAELQRIRLRINSLESKVGSNLGEWMNPLINYYSHEITELQSRLRTFQMKHRASEEQLVLVTKELAKLGLETNMQKLKIYEQRIETSGDIMKDSAVADIQLDDCVSTLQEDLIACAEPKIKPKHEELVSVTEPVMPTNEHIKDEESIKVEKSDVSPDPPSICGQRQCNDSKENTTPCVQQLHSVVQNNRNVQAFKIVPFKRYNIRDLMKATAERKEAKNRVTNGDGLTEDNTVCNKELSPGDQ